MTQFPQYHQQQYTVMLRSDPAQPGRVSKHAAHPLQPILAQPPHCTPQAHPALERQVNGLCTDASTYAASPPMRRTPSARAAADNVASSVASGSAALNASSR